MMRTRSTAELLIAVEDEISRQKRLWGEQNHKSFIEPGRFKTVIDLREWRAAYYGVSTEAVAKADLELALNQGRLTYADIFMEEVAEVIGCMDEASLQNELTQVAAVCISWISAIERRQAKEISNV